MTPNLSTSVIVNLDPAKALAGLEAIKQKSAEIAAIQDKAGASERTLGAERAKRMTDEERAAKDAAKAAAARQKETEQAYAKEGAAHKKLMDDQVRQGREFDRTQAAAADKAAKDATKTAAAKRAEVERDYARQGADHKALLATQARQGQEFDRTQRAAATHAAKDAAKASATARTEIERDYARQGAAHKKLMADQTRQANDYARFQQQQASAAAAVQARAAAAAQAAANRTAQGAYYRTVAGAPTMTAGAIQSQINQFGSQWTAQQQQRMTQLLQSRSFTTQWADAGRKAAGFFSSAFGSAMPALMGGVGLVAFGKAVFTRSTALETLRLQLQGVYKDAETAQKQYDFLIKKSIEYGVNPTQFGKTAARLASGAQVAGFKPEEVNYLTEQVMKLKVALNMNPESLDRTAKAFSDMLSKGTVQMEELKGQLGDHLPGAMALAAKAVGKTVPEMVKMMKAGALDANLFVKAMAIQMDLEYTAVAKKASTSSAFAVSQLQTQISLSAELVGKGFNGAVAEAARGMTAALANPEGKAMLVELGKAMGEFVKWLMKAAKETITWVRQNKDMIKTAAEWAVTLGKVVFAWKALTLVIGAPIAIFASMATAMRGIATLFGVTLPAAGTTWAAATTAQMSAVSRAAIVAGSVIRGALTVGALGLGVGAIIAGQRRDKVSAEEAYSQTDASNIKSLTAEQLRAARDKLVDKSDSMTNEANRYGPDQVRRFFGGTVQNDQIKKRVQESDAQLIKTEAREKVEATKAAKAADEAELKRVAEQEAKLKALQAQMGTGGKAKKPKADGSGTLASAQIDAARKQYAEEKALLDEQLAAAEVSYKAYYDRLAVLRGEEHEAEVASLKESRKAASLKPKEREAIDEKIKASESKRDADLAVLRKQQAKQEQDLRAQVIDYIAQREEQAAVGTVARIAQIEERWRLVLARLRMEGNVKGIAAVEGIKGREKSDVMVDDAKRGGAIAEAQAGVKRAQVELEVSQHKLTEVAAAQKLYLIEKEIAATQQKSLEAELAALQAAPDQEATLLRRLELEQKILEAKSKQNEESPVKKEITGALEDGFREGFTAILNGKGGVKGALKAVRDNLKDTIFKSIADGASKAFTTTITSLMENLMNYLSSAVGSAGGGGGGGGGGMGILGSIISIGSSIFGGSSGSGALAVGDESIANSLMDSPGTSSGWQSVAPSGSFSSGVTMNISTPDANSFRASSTQISWDTGQALGRAGGRNG